jgi:hypothetical protein
VSKRKRHREPVEMNGEGLWVYSDRLPDGRYGSSVSIGKDHVWPLHDPITYATVVIRVAITAQHDAAVVRLLHEHVGVPLEAVGALLTVLRDGERGRPPVEVLPDLTMTPGVNQRFEPFIVTEGKGIEPFQNTVEEIIGHAVGALQGAVAAELDTRLYREAIDTLELDEGRAGAIVAHLSAYWPGRYATDG